MKGRVKGFTVGPATVIMAASTRLPGSGRRRHKRSDGTLRRNVAAMSGVAKRVRSTLRQLERMSMILGVAAAGMELVREIRTADSNGTPSGRKPARSSRSRSGGSASRATSSTTKSPVRTKAQGNRTTSKKTRRSRTVAKRRRPAARKAGATRRTARKATRSRSASKTSASGRPR
jgi:hypothetical protein